ncbi:hypothetical protein GC163_11565 [bacterium]|nr:hypothetical protein [bacterium]
MTTTAPRSRRLLILSLLAVIVGGVIYEGADRDPADASRPLVHHANESTTNGATPLSRPLTSNFVTIASFNIHSGKGTDGQTDLSRIQDLIGGCDLAALYEVRAPLLAENQATQLSPKIYREAWFAATERHWYHEHFGNALLSRVAVTQVQRLPLPGTRGKAFRNAILAYVPWKDQTLKLLAVHIDREQDRQMQLQLITQLFLALEAPAILVGDLNTPANDPLLDDLRRQPQVTSPLHDVMNDGVPAGNIDWIFAKGLTTMTADIFETEASDHPMIRAKLRRTTADDEPTQTE